MSDRTVKHEVKLQKSVTVILAVIAFGLCANAFAPVFAVKDAMAQLGSMEIKLSNSSPYGSFKINCSGCD